MHGSGLLATVGDGEVEGELGYATRLGASRQLERLDHARDGLVLDSAVLALGLLAHHNEVDIVVAELETRQALDAHHVRIQVELKSQLLIHRLELAGLANRRSGQVSLETNAVALEALDQLIHRGASTWQQFAFLFNKTELIIEIN